MTRLVLVAAGMLVLGAQPSSAQHMGPGMHHWPSHAHHYPVWPSVRPSFPVAVTPSVVTSVNPVTGGLNTANHQVNNTAYDPFRNLSAHNGSRRWVRRPVYDRWGRVVGYKEGWVWNNSLTGQEHGQINMHTPNGLGGVNTTQQHYSSRP